MKKGHIPGEMYLQQHCCQTVSHTARNKSCCTEAQNSLPLLTILGKQVLKNIILKF